ncbi:hypothetical protein GGR50DRAFT_163965 [Xylaria sp. CBS 124048]|nr:hypothetical protein GGR50DRAFT_163965 [Xylaria sp. CBS 124048]
MGNTHTKEERAGPQQASSSASAEAGAAGLLGAGRHAEFASAQRATRAELSPLGVAIVNASASNSRPQDTPFERRETKQEREARKLEKERVARVKERERSMKEEHVDGGYLVTMGIYTASEDFNKPIVRQLQIERKIAPFWRGLDDFNKTWAEHQIIAAARGLEIPPADEVPEDLIPQPRPPQESIEASPLSLNNLTVPLGARTLSSASDRGGSNPGSAIPSPTSPALPRTTSPLKQPKKALAAALNLSRNNSQSDIAPREINLPHDPFVNGQAVEVFLYKEGEECPLCLMYYPPYLNRTRCCCQLICSECFVQIKRPDPHFPDHHGDAPSTETPPADPEDQDAELTMEPAKCPYCTQSDFGVTYDPPAFRRGLAYAFSPSSLGAMSTARSSSSSLNSSLSPTATNSGRPTRNRAQSVSANAPGVITADRIRPDWSAKLATARAHRRRRAAAADALHHAAFVMGNQESRTIFGRPTRFSRRPAGGYRGTDSPGGSAPDGTEDASHGPDSSTHRRLSRERMDAAHLENLMMAEAIRLSLADEEERRKKAEKEARKEAKKREKEERKAAKKKGEEVYKGRNSSVSSLSLGLGWRRGNNSTGNLRLETAAAPTAAAIPLASVPGSPTQDKGKGIERGIVEEASTSAAGPSSATPVLSPQARGVSHLRQMSNASSISTNEIDSLPASYTAKGPGTEESVGGGLNAGRQTERVDNASPEILFNFRSLAEVVGVSLDGETENQKTSESPSAVHEEHVEAAQSSGKMGSRPQPIHTSTQTSIASKDLPPKVVVVPNTPAPGAVDDDQEVKRFSRFDTTEASHEVAQ